ncbi:hypothetical protein Tco_0920702, partial [Tanacetum coccineum]
MADALSQKERNKPLRVRALMMTVYNDLPKQIREDQKEAMKRKNVRAENLGILIKQIFKFRPDGTRCFGNHILEIASEGVRDKFGHEYRLPPSNGWSKRKDYINARRYVAIKVAPYEALYGKLTGPELIRDTTKKIVQIKNRLLTARSRQKSHADRRTKPLEFEVSDMVLLKVSPWKGA